MKIRWFVLFGVFAVWVSPAFCGTFTTVDTLIPVPASATATAAGDTSPNTASTIHLDARVYIPDGLNSPAPVVVIIHGFGGSKATGTVTTIAQDFASNGYVVLTPTTRGFGDSDGLVTLAGPNEVNDLKTIILAMQTGMIGDSPAIPIPVNSTSKFGVTGASYGGGHAFEIMRTHVAGLTAVAPVIGWTNLYQALAPNDVPKLSFTIGLFGGGFDPGHPNYDDVMFNWAKDIIGGHPEDTKTGGPAQNLDWRSVIFNPAELTVPAFVVQGWNDYLFPAEQATSLFQTGTGIPFFKMYLGGIGHPPASSDVTTPEALYLRAQTLRWFDHWLKGINNGIDTEPRVTVAPARTDSWTQASLKTANTFPLPGTTTTTYFFNGTNLSASSPAKGNPILIKPTTIVPGVLQPLVNALGSDASTLIAAIIAANGSINSGGDIFSPSLETGPDNSANSARFITKPLTQSVRVTGLPHFHLFVSATAANGNYYVSVLERTPNGTEHLVGRGAFKDRTSNFGGTHAIDFDGFAINRTFDAGNRIVVRVASRDFPFFLPKSNQPSIKIYRNSSHASKVTLPISP